MNQTKYLAKEGLAHTLLNLLELSLHIIIARSGLYPETIFVKKNTFGQTCLVSASKKLNGYISAFIETIQKIIYSLISVQLRTQSRSFVVRIIRLEGKLMPLQQRVEPVREAVRVLMNLPQSQFKHEEWRLLVHTNGFERIQNILQSRLGKCQQTERGQANSLQLIKCEQFKMNLQIYQKR